MGQGVDAFVEEMARRGFVPRVVDDGGDEVDVVLDACPFVDAAAADPALVCSVHRGLAEGVAEVADDIEVRGLRVEDPSRAGCVVRLVRRDPQQG